ncbi:MAG: class II fructose-bisphosphate aldolase [bacterium]|nr:class II fructose-bisphosphate aldolase [bacterium]MDZ4299743.1 class II fructose-bisphosphate aldolase [Candidatus Sungbacteria bacterium]
MELLKTILERALAQKWSTGHFNVSESDHMRAVVEACREVGAPAMIGLSEGERAHLGVFEAVALRDAFRHEFSIPVFLNADHSKSVAAAKAALDAGFDSIHIDLSAKSLEENTAGTREVVLYARAKNPDVSVEGELGYLKGESRVLHEKITISRDDYTKPEEAKRFVSETRIDRLAIVVGNIHGISLEEPDLDIDRIREIRGIISQETALVLHAGSGIPDDQIKAAIVAGIANIHINTDLRVAYAAALRAELAAHRDEVAMYKLDAPAREAMKQIIKAKLTLFGSVERL